MGRVRADPAKSPPTSLIAPNNVVAPGPPDVFTPEQLVAWKKITDAVHAKGGKIFSQLWHPGHAAHCNNDNGVHNVGPSAIAIDGETHTLQGKQRHALSHQLTLNDIVTTVVEQFGTAAKNVIDVARFDGVEIHGANGCLIEQPCRLAPTPARINTVALSKAVLAS
ncbi:hypothetical protein LEN26_016335 [Aphanomyces euteiches]|nr:hypothetical protein LEN26_016335 [Aphanomyces euteiches]KAH9121857.1 hypothetical protein AeMF1_006590 [Aphanomyces euteiches]KAH9182366.1 hypothetical protein AeNC1_015660 [Aphanomyces euteiches]